MPSEPSEPPSQPRGEPTDGERHGEHADAFAIAYEELKAIARRCMAGERRSHTLQPTALVHEAWGRLQGRLGSMEVVDFKALVATTMRRILVDHARRRAGPVHGGGVPHVRLTAIHDVDGGGAPDLDVLALDDALTRLGHSLPDHARIVELRFFAGLTNPEIARLLGKGLATVEERWRFARAWLRRGIDGPAANS